MSFKAEEIPFLQEIYRPPKGQPEIDLCFVHGLNPWSNPNHAYDTWTHLNGTFWPYDLLREDIPEARIFVYGYNSNVAKEVSEARIKDHANVLLDRLQRRRKVGRKHGTTPIIFVAHSLGGLVVKQALLNARDDITFEPVKKCTYGLVFFGTPHRGGRGAAFGVLAARIAKFVSADRADNDLLECLKSNSLFTREASDRFSHQLENYKVISFFETKPMKLGIRGIAENCTGEWSFITNFTKTGADVPVKIVVEEESAVLRLPGSRERREALNADHSEMCKIGTKGAIYEGVAGKLRDMVDEALTEYESNTAAGAQNDFLETPRTQQGRSPSPMLSPQAQRGRAPNSSDVSGRTTPAVPVRSTAPQVVKDVAEALYNYVPTAANVSDLGLIAGDIITNIEKPDENWWRGTNARGQSGLFPSNYVRILPQMLPAAEPTEVPFSRPNLMSSNSTPMAETASVPNVHRAQSEADLTAQTMEVGRLHQAYCDHCLQQIRGVRHKCTVCADWDYCAGCVIRAHVLHNPAHAFRPIYDPEEPTQAAQPSVPSPGLEVERPMSQASTITASEAGLAKQIETLANAILISSLLDTASGANQPADNTRNVVDVTDGEPAASASTEQQVQPAVQEPQPVPSIIPKCSMCRLYPEDYPVYTCDSCLGKTIICRNCTRLLGPNSPNTVHKNHKIRILYNDIWFTMIYVYLKTADPPVDQFTTAGWGPQWSVQTLTQLKLGYNPFSNCDVLNFGPRPWGNLRLTVMNVPAGNWAVRLQISTWNSPYFGDAELKKCGTIKNLSVHAGTTSLGCVNWYVGVPPDAVGYLDRDEGNPVQMFASNCIRYNVPWGANYAVKIALPYQVIISDTGPKDLGIYVEYMRNHEAFNKQHWELQQRLSFCWRLEGIRFVHKSDILAQG